MSEFKTKSIDHTFLGVQLRRIRERRKWTRDQVARASRIQERYVEAIETGAYQRLPHGFAEKILRRYAQTLRVSPQNVLAWYRVETLELSPRALSPVASKAGSAVVPVLVLPSLFKRLGVILFLGLILSYLGYQLYSVIAPPMLNVDAPLENAVVHAPAVILSGSATPESSVTMNGETLPLNEHGQFRQEITLQEGMNVLRIEGRKDRSRPKILYRKVLFEK